MLVITSIKDSINSLYSLPKSLSIRQITIPFYFNLLNASLGKESVIK